MPRKVLITGPIRGNYDALLKRLQSVQSKAGPFEAVFCIGSSTGDASSDATDKFISDSQELSFPAYVFDDGGPFTCRVNACVPMIMSCQIATSPGRRKSAGFGTSEISSRIEATPACPVEALTSHGLRTIAGLQVAFLNVADKTVADQLIEEINAADGDIDLLITSEWPAHITELATPPSGVAPDGSAIVSEVAQAARPRYHISTAPETFYQREPYMNPDRGAGSHATRFISLGAVGNAAKAKWVHALALEPASTMSAADISAVPQQSTKSPYIFSVGKKRKAAPQQSWRFQEGSLQSKRNGGAATPDPEKTIRVKNIPFAASEDDVSAYFSRAGVVVDVMWKSVNGKRASWLTVQFSEAAAVVDACKLSGHLMMGREITVIPKTQEGQEADMPLNLGQAVKDCWFCLSNDQADVQLVVDVLDEAYIATDKGPIDDTHALIVSIEHYPNTVTLQDKALAEVHTLMSALQRGYATKGLKLVGFERYLAFHSRGGNHCHLNFIGISDSAASESRQIVENAAKAHQFSFSHIPAGDPKGLRSEVKQLVQSAQYFQFFLPDGSRLVHPIDRNEKHPMNFGRDCLARLAGVPHRADWRQCQAASAAEEEDKTNIFKQFWQPFTPNKS
eukprot:jgi/Ulvmu1/12062/UM083_0075.1